MIVPPHFIPQISPEDKTGLAAWLARFIVFLDGHSDILSHFASASEAGTRRRILSESSEPKDLNRKIGGADGNRIHQPYGNKGVLRCSLAF
jgi:hypothetical protein